MSSADLRQGTWQETLASLEAVDAVITDPPFSERTDKGFLSFSDVKREKRAKRSGNGTKMPARRNEMPYAPICEEDVELFVSKWHERIRWFAIIFGDHVSMRWWERWWTEAGWLTFAPIPWVKKNAPPRFHGDGPANACEWITVARPRHKMPKERSGSRPGYYIGHQMMGNQRDKVIIGQKPVELMMALVRAYTLPGDLVCDPFAGSASTLIAAQIEGRRSVGAEKDPETFRRAKARLDLGYTPTLSFGKVEISTPSKPLSLFGDD